MVRASPSRPGLIERFFLRRSSSDDHGEDLPWASMDKRSGVCPSRGADGRNDGVRVCQALHRTMQSIDTVLCRRRSPRGAIRSGIETSAHLPSGTLTPFQITTTIKLPSFTQAKQ